jgi:uncharacterized protein YecE (DUF72 family)
LGGKLACLLIQLPPKFDYNIGGLESFFELLDHRFNYAIEFRNLSWMRDETWELLKEHEVAYTIVDEPLLPPEVHLTADLAYFRWHGRGEKPWFNYRYNSEELDHWVPRVQEISHKVKKIVGYFNNHFHGYAPENCLQLLEKLNLLSKEQKKAKEKTASKQSQLSLFLE